MKKNKLAFSIPTAVAFVLSIVGYFLPFFKAKGSYLLGSFGEAFEWSVIDFTEKVFELLDYQEDAGVVLLIMLVILCFIPALLSLIGAITSLALKPRAGGVIATVMGSIGLLSAILWRVVFSIEISDGLFGSVSLSDIIEFDIGAIVNGISYVVCIGLGIAMICVFKKEKNAPVYAQDFQQGGMYQDPAYGNQQGYMNPAYDNNNTVYGGQGYQDPGFGGGDFYGNGGTYGADYDGSTDVTRLPDANGFEDEGVTVRLTPEMPQVEAPKVVEPPKKQGSIACTAGKFKGAKFPISDGETIFVGRDPKQCSIVIDKDCVYVGRKHCSITYDATYSKYLICVFSQNGVVLPNGNRIKDGERAVLSVGSAIELGNKDNVLELY